MCGIVSTISKRQGGFFASDLDVFEQLLVLDTLRGLDSTGVFCVDSGRGVGIMKVASHPYHLFATQEYPKFRSRAVSQGRILVGHNRKATQGSINSRNAHPFHSGNIVLIHNGTLRGDHKKDYAPTEVDSHALAVAFDERGAENVIPSINGAFALMWWNVEKNRLYAVRNDERPLWIVETDENYYLVSEAWMALQLLSRANKKVLNCEEIKPGKLYEFQIGGQHTITDIEVQQDYYSNMTTTYMTGRQHHQRTSAANAPSVSAGKFPSSYGGQTGGSSQSQPQSETTGTPTTTSPLVGPQPSQQSTALTLVKNQSLGTDDKGAGKPAPSPLPVDMANHVPCDEFIRGQTVLIKAYEMKLSDNKALYVLRGKVVEPGVPEIDVMAYMKAADIPDGELVKYMNSPLEAKVVKHTTSVCGRSLYVNQLSFPEKVEVHNNRVTETEWNYVTTYCKCDVCAARVYDEEHEFTSVTRLPHNKFKVTCADCIEKTLKGNTQYEFQQNRLASLQDHLRVQQALAGSALGGIEAPGTPTLQ